ncbi:hypothetical protein FQA39_LY07855 [Lamprigera yunnana]|nr:hypothetical protein FQA39_LY07855 [Lamprigera yunnana]
MPDIDQYCYKLRVGVEKIVNKTVAIDKIVIVLTDTFVVFNKKLILESGIIPIFIGRSERLHNKAKIGVPGDVNLTSVHSSTKSAAMSMQSNKSFESTSKRQKLDAELEILSRKKKLELEIKGKETEQELLNLELEIRKATIYERNAENIDTCSTLITHLDDRGNDIDKYQQLRVSDIPLNAKKQAGTFDIFRKSNSQPVDMNMMLSRQSVPKDLLYFNGDQTEWPNFIAQYRNTAIRYFIHHCFCRYSVYENLVTQFYGNIAEID